ncbi:MAG: butyrate kinase [candidate division Zixibacteria bacterium]|nr:butyrate kinase [candidate division Zixibacteria bacterium]
MTKKMLIVNPGSTSTKVALFEGETQQSEEVIRHDADELARFDNVADQFDFRMEGINGWIDSLHLEAGSLSAVVGRGAPLKPLEGGSYGINDELLEAVRTGKYSNHASNLGPLIAAHLGVKYDIPSLIADPITVDNFTDVARVSGLPEIPRKCRAHALNIKEVCRREAIKLGKCLETTSFVAAHMGGGISVAALQHGKIIDVNDGLLGMGPFSPDRAGALPVGGLVKLCFSGKYTEKELVTKLSRQSGLTAYLGESDLREVEKMIAKGDEKAKLCFSAMAYQIAKEIGSAATVLCGVLDAVVLTGGMANSKQLIAEITKYISYLGDIRVVPGEFEMEALAAAGMRYLGGEEELKVY